MFVCLTQVKSIVFVISVAIFVPFADADADAIAIASSSLLAHQWSSNIGDQNRGKE